MYRRESGYVVKYDGLPHKMVEFLGIGGLPQPSLRMVNEVAKKEFPDEKLEDLVLTAGEDQDGFPVILSRTDKVR